MFIAQGSEKSETRLCGCVVITYVAYGSDEGWHLEVGVEPCRAHVGLQYAEGEM